MYLILPENVTREVDVQAQGVNITSQKFQAGI